MCACALCCCGAKQTQHVCPAPLAQVDEFGTEAAAVTAVIVGKAALPPNT